MKQSILFLIEKTIKHIKISKGNEIDYIVSISMETSYIFNNIYNYNKYKNIL